MHLTLKKATTRPSGMNFLQQQDKFDSFIHEYNYERPHEGINMMLPSEIYTKSKKEYLGIAPFNYSMCDRTVYVTHCGRICFQGKKINLSKVFAGIEIGIRQVEDKIWLASFLQYDIGFFDTLSARFEPADNPFGSKVVTYVLSTNCYLCVRTGPEENWRTLRESNPRPPDS